MGILNNFEPETLGVFFVLGVIAIIILFVMFFVKIFGRKPVEDDLSDVLRDCEIFEADEDLPSESEVTPEEVKADQSVVYQLKEYTIRFDLIDGLWTPFAIIGAHVSEIKKVRPNQMLRGAMMDTFVFLKVQPTSKVA